MEFRKILCPIDFSDASRAALRAAVALAQKLGSEITLLHVYQPPGVSLPDGSLALGGPAEMGALAQKVDEAMKEWQAEARSLGSEVASGTAIGTTHAEIERVAEEGDHDLIVMGTHGRTGLAHALLGSTAEKVIQRAPCPVLTVRPTW
jgi:nucleotide-binding universal stress UspA family protein